MSSVRDLNTRLNTLLKQVIPEELFKVGYIGDIVVVNQDEDLFIQGIINGALANVLFEDLKFRSSVRHASKVEVLSRYYICHAYPTELAEILSELSLEEKAKLSKTIGESFIKDSCLRASQITENLAGGIQRHGLENTGVSVEVRKMRDALKNPPKTLQDVFTLNDNLTKLADSYKEEKQIAVESKCAVVYRERANAI